MTAPDNVGWVAFVDDVASLIEQVALGIHFATLEVIGGIPTFLGIMAENDLFRVAVSVKDSDDTFDFEFYSLKIEERRQLALLPNELLFDELDLALIINDIAVVVNQPSSPVYTSQVLVNSLAELVLKEQRILVLIVIKVAHAAMRIEVVPLKPLRHG